MQVTTNSGVVTTNYAPNDYAVLTQGQLKQFTARAVDELNAGLTNSGGAGINLNTLVSNWAADYATNNYSNSTNTYAPYNPQDFTVMNVGQLKYIGNLVWSRLVVAGYTNAAPSWLQATNTDNEVANLGQLKTVFNFDLILTGIPYWWETEYLGQTGANPNSRDLSTGLTYWDEYLYDLNPTSGTTDSNGISYAWEIQYYGQLGVDPDSMDSSTGFTAGQEYQYGIVPVSGLTDTNGISYAWEIQYFGQIGIDPNADPDGDSYSNIYEFLHGTDPTTASSVPTPDLVVGSAGFGTIQSALNAVTSDDQIIAVMPGTYQENLKYSQHKVMLVSTNGAASTIIDARESGPGVVLSDDSIIDDFTIINSSGPAVNIESGQNNGRANVSMVNCVLYGNQSSRGIICANASNVTVINCTLFNNVLNSGSFAIQTYGGTATLVNTILWDGGNEIGVDSLTARATVAANYCDIESATVFTGQGNINSNPQLWAGEDGHITAGSPCIGVGTSSGAPCLDMDNEPRPSSNGSYDMGADQYADSDNNGIPDWWQTQYQFYGYSSDPNWINSNGVTNLQSYQYGIIPYAGPTDSSGLFYAWEIQNFGRIGLNPNAKDPSNGFTYLGESQTGIGYGSSTMDSNGLSYSWELYFFGYIGINANDYDPVTRLSFFEDYQYGLYPYLDQDYGIVPYSWEIQYLGQVIYWSADYMTDPANGLTYLQEYENGIVPGSLIDNNGLSVAWEMQYFGQVGLDSTTVDNTGLTYLEEYQYGITPGWQSGLGPYDSNGLPYAWEAEYVNQIGIDPNATDSTTGLTYQQDYTYGVNPGSGTIDSNGLPYAWEIQYYGQTGLDPNATDPSTQITYSQEYTNGVIPGSGPNDSNGLPYAWELAWFGYTGVSGYDSINGVSYAQDYQYGLWPNSTYTDDVGVVPYSWEIQYFGQIWWDADSNVDSANGLTYLQEYQNAIAPGSGPIDNNGLSYSWEMQYFGQIRIDSSQLDGSGLTYLQEYQFGMTPGWGWWQSNTDSNGFLYSWEAQYLNQIGIDPNATDSTTGLTYQQDYTYGVNPGTGTIDSNGISYAWEIEYYGQLGIDPDSMDSSTGYTAGEEFQYGIAPGSGLIDSNGISYAWEIQYFGQIGIDPNADPDGDGYSNIYESIYGTDPTSGSDVPSPSFVVDANGSTAYRTIQSALNAVTSDYQIIAVMPGTYRENLTSSQYKIMLCSLSGAAATIIDAHQGGSAIILGKDSIIDDFTIIHSSGPALDIEPGQNGSQTNALMINCVLYGDQSNRGILYANASNLRVTNCTLFNNALSSGSCAIQTNGGTATLVNTILWDGGNEIGVDSLSSQTTVTVTYCDIESATVHAGQGNINGNPQFWAGNNGHITAGSPCIGTGTYSRAPCLDMDNEPRPSSNGGYDIGADQYTDSGGGGLPDWWQMLYYNEIGYSPDAYNSADLTNLQSYQYDLSPYLQPTDSNGLTYSWEIQNFGRIGLNRNATDPSNGFTYLEESQYGIPFGSGPIDGGGLPYDWELYFFGYIGVNAGTYDYVTGLSLGEDYEYGLYPYLDHDYGTVPYSWEIQYLGQVIYWSADYMTDPVNGLTYLQEYENGIVPGSLIDNNGLSFAWEMQYFGQVGIDSSQLDGSGLTYLQEYQFGMTPGWGWWQSNTDSNGLPYAWEAQYLNRIGIDPSATDSTTGLTYQQDYTYGVNPGSGTIDSNGLPYAWEIQYYGQTGLDPNATDPSTQITYSQEYTNGVSPGSALTDSNGLPYAWEMQYFGYIGLDPTATDTSTGFTYQQDYDDGVAPESGPIDSNGIPYAWEMEYYGNLGIDPNSMDSSTGYTAVQEYQYGVIPGSGFIDSNGISYAWEIQYFGQAGIDPNADPDGDGYPNIYEYTHGTDPTSASSVPNPDLIVGWGGSDGIYIQSALDAVTSDYQIIAVMPDTYRENLTTHYKVMLCSTNGAAATIIQPAQTGSAIVAGNDCVIEGFTISHSSGPAVDVEPNQNGGESNVSLVNCLLYGNLNNGEGIFYVQGSNLTAVNCTVFNNILSPGSFAIQTHGGTAKLVNTILWDGGDEIGVDSLSGQTSVTATYCDIAGATVYPGQGNLNANPHLWPGFNGHITAESPCIDAGTSSGAPNLDMDNEPRPSAHGGYDIGVDQFVDSDGNGLPDWWQMLYFGQLGNSPTTGDFNGLTNLQTYQYALNPNGSGTDANGLPYTWELQNFGQIGINSNTTDLSTGFTYLQEFQNNIAPGSGALESNGLPYAWELQYFGQYGVDPSNMDSTGYTYLQDYQYGITPKSGPIDTNGIAYTWEIQHFGHIGVNPSTVDLSTGLTYPLEYDYGINPGAGTTDSNGFSYSWEIQYYGQIGLDPNSMDYSTGLMAWQEYQYGIVPGSGSVDSNGISYSWEIQYFSQIGIDPNADPDGDGYSNIYEFIHGTAPTSLNSVPMPDLVVDINGSTPYTTIQSALNAVRSDYQIISVMPGTYRENLTGNPYKVTLCSINGAASTIIDAQQTGPAIVMSDDSTIDDFTITHSSGPAVDFEPGQNGSRTNARMINCVLYATSRIAAFSTRMPPI